MSNYFMYTDTPVGTALLTSQDDIITGLHWKVFKRAPVAQADWIEDPTPFQTLLSQLDEYFAGKRQTFELPFRTTGTAFQMQVWNALNEIPFGHSCTYSDIAAKVGRPRALQAVGTAIGSNPISIIVPCHRVLAAGQRITGYAGGVESKAMLLTLEKVPYRMMSPRRAGGGSV